MRDDTASDRDVLAKTEDYVRGQLGSEPTGHDWWHADRVRSLAKHIAAHEGADMFVVELAALLHDVADAKFTGSDGTGPRAAREWLGSLPVEPGTVESVATIIERMSYKGALVPEEPLSVEGRCVQDADRLDAMGAIGIARTFAYGGYVRRPLHDPETPAETHATADAYRNNVGTTINHFHEKLLLLKDRLHTEPARRIAEQRHDFMMLFLDRFHDEWHLGRSD
ncbi:MAG TPA: HD domain-containing protein, partial [Pseudonocardiaceae bacterium]|nr:HD domain-containing protein [Pseudonocardiaceae bacterium]